MKESDIVYENGDFWVLNDRGYLYHVMKNGSACAETNSENDAYPVTEDGLSLAKSRADYLAGRSI